jgi:hypothetical protein
MARAQRADLSEDFDQFPLNRLSFVTELRCTVEQGANLRERRRHARERVANALPYSPRVTFAMSFVRMRQAL